MIKPLSRRTFLRGAGGVAIGLPLLDAMIPTARAGGEEGPRKRFVVFFSANGTIEEAFRPEGGVDDFSFTRPGGGQHILSPLEPIRDDLIVLWGLDMVSRSQGPGGNGHDMGMGHMLTCQELLVGPSGIGEFSHLPDGSAGGISIDQEIANRIGSETPFRSLEFGVRSLLDLQRQVTSRMCYRGPFEALPPENDPAAAFDALFTDLGTDPTELAALRARRGSVLDKVTDDFNRLNAKVGAGDRVKLEAHLDAIRELEQSLYAEGGPLEACALPERPEGLDPNSNDQYPDVGRAQMDLMTMALTCDLTRVASIQWSTAQSGIRHSWLGHSANHHSLSHEADNDATARQQLIEINQWYAEQYLYLVQAMKSVPEGDGTMLDNSVVLWVNEQGNGDLHTSTDVPFVMAGSAGGYLNTGRNLQIDGRAHNDLFVSMLHAMGQTDTNTFGLPELCQGPLDELT